MDKLEIRIANLEKLKSQKIDIEAYLNNFVRTLLTNFDKNQIKIYGFENEADINKFENILINELKTNLDMPPMNYTFRIEKTLKPYGGNLGRKNMVYKCGEFNYTIELK